MKIGILGGTFDPFHIADAAIVKQALTKVDKVIIVPTVCNYYRKEKEPLFSFDNRVRIIRDFVAGITGNVEIDTIEKYKDSKWRYINTLEYIKKSYPNDELFTIIGEDSYNKFDTWFRYDEILSLSKLMVVNRSKDFVPTKYNAQLLKIDGMENVSSSKIRERLLDELIDMYLSDREAYALN